jgi:carboxyl-terminal processing protease
MNNQSYRMWTVVVAIALMALSFAAGLGARNASLYGLAAHIAQWMPGLTEAQPEVDIPTSANLAPLATFWEVHNRITSFYVYPVEDQTQLTYGAIRGMVGALEDPFSHFLEPKQFQDFCSQTEGSFEGIGAWMEQERPGADKPARIIIMSVIPEGPAAKAGVRQGDVVVAVDGKPTADQSLQQVVDLIKGRAGTTVTLSLRREGVVEPLEISVARAKVEVPVVETEILPGNIGYLWLRMFNKQADREAREALQELLSQKITGLVFDLSMNGGGLLDQAISVGSLFFKEGPIVLVQERGAQPQPYNVVPGQIVPPDLPMVVLVDRGTASASEIVSGALQDRGRAKIVGTSTFGKSKVQTVLKLNDGSALILSTAIYLTPKLHDLSENWPDDKTKRGLRPDVLLPEPSPDAATDYAAWHKEQVRQAATLLRRELAAGPGTETVPAG